MGSLDGLPGDGTAIMERRARFGSEMFSGGVVISFRHGAGGNSEQN
jgi:hypothetical protein